MMQHTTNFVKPLYDSSCFSSLPHNIKNFLIGQEPFRLPPQVPETFLQQYETVIFFFIDSFGWRFIEKHCDRSPFLQQIVKEGVLTPITSQFPSTTSAHVTTIHTGLEVGQSGIFEWQFYEPKLDSIIVPLLFSYAGTMKRDTLNPEKVKAEELFPMKTLYQDLGQHGITSHVFQHREFTPSTFSNVMFQGAKTLPFLTLTEALVNMEMLLKQKRPQSYFFLYFDRIDTICHYYGPNSPQVEAEIENLLTILEHWFQRLSRLNLKKTLFIMSADHGQMEVDPQTTTYLNRDPEFSGFDQYIKINRQGELLVPGGSSRGMVLYIKDDRLEEAQEFLKNRLNGKAEVYQTQDLIKQGLYGALPPSPTFLSRMGNLVILPYPHQKVWWYKKGQPEEKMLGQHGGLSKEEMEIPLLLYNFEM